MLLLGSWKYVVVVITNCNYVWLFLISKSPFQKHAYVHILFGSYITGGYLNSVKLGDFWRIWFEDVDGITYDICKNTTNCI